MSKPDSTSHPEFDVGYEAGAAEWRSHSLRLAGRIRRLEADVEHLRTLLLSLHDYAEGFHADCDVCDAIHASGRRSVHTVKAFDVRWEDR